MFAVQTGVSMLNFELSRQLRAVFKHRTRQEAGQALRLPREENETRHEDKNHDQVLSSALLIQIALLPDFADSQADFYRGKTITIIHGRSAGGSGDLRART
jgi:hypothetical protein